MSPQAHKIGVGSRIVGCTTLTGNRYISLACEVCSRCGGAGKKAPTIIAGKPVGGDEKYLCHLCGGAGARAFGLFVSGENRLKNGRTS